MEKLRQQEEQRIQMQRLQHGADQPEHEMTTGNASLLFTSSFAFA